MSIMKNLELRIRRVDERRIDDNKTPLGVLLSGGLLT